MKSLSSCLAALLAGLVVAIAPARAADPYTVTVWARVLFAVDGKAGEFTVIDEAAMPAKFVEGVKARSRACASAADGRRQAGHAAQRRAADFAVTPGDTGGACGWTRCRWSRCPHPLRGALSRRPGQDWRVGEWCRGHLPGGGGRTLRLRHRPAPAGDA
jgi:hypothetical protein